MKNRFMSILTAVLITMLLASCAEKPDEAEHPGPDAETIATVQPGIPATVNDSPGMTSDTTIVPESSDLKPLHPLKDELSDLWGRIDGSTATIPLTSALYEAIEGGSQPPIHNTTPDAYGKLINDEGVDLIFVTYPSANEFRMASENGVELEIIPVTKDALVFLVNSENPVNNVSLSQLQDVYSGKIKNWMNLSGLNENITAFQRPNDSGSQTLFLKLVMDGLPLMAPPNEWIIREMTGLVESISNYDNSRRSIGYSMFYFVNNMYGNSRFKLLCVDDVAPTRETIARGEYPLEDHYYAVIRKDEQENHPARKLIEWLLTDEGQTLAIRAGYIPLRPIEGISDGDDIDPIYLGDTDNSSGTGGTILKKGVEDAQPKNGIRPPLSDLFFDGFNYIRYINDRITASLTFFDYDKWQVVTWWEQYQKRPFTGIPNDYPNYEINYMGSLTISIPSANPFFGEGKSFYIWLTEDISPYGRDLLMSYSVTYHYDRRVLPLVDLFTVSVSIHGNPEASERINEQLNIWTDSFPNTEVSIKSFNNFKQYCIDAGITDPYPGFICKLKPVVSLWQDYLSVTYMYTDGEFIERMVCTICFDVRTCKTVDLSGLLPDELDFSKADINLAIDLDSYGSDSYSTKRFPPGYIPAAGSVIVDAWIVYDKLHIVLSEPGGRLLEAVFLD